MIGDFVILQDIFSPYMGLELEREKAAGKELILDSPKAYFASYFVFFKSVPVISLLFGSMPYASSH